MTVEYRHNVATAATIEGHLAECDAFFEPRLSLRVELGAYSQKLVSQAERFEAWAGSELVGLVAAYCNDTATGRAFVTSVSVSPRWTGKGLALQLMNECLAHAGALGMTEVRLEVGRMNERAIGLYVKLGFVEVPSSGAMVTMRRAISAE